MGFGDVYKRQLQRRGIALALHQAVPCLARGEEAELLLGVYLLKNAYWPSSCRPDTFVKAVTCSIRLPESRHWIEAALLTWLWSTPILVLLDISRRYRAWADKRAEAKAVRVR